MGNEILSVVQSYNSTTKFRNSELLQTFQLITEQQSCNWLKDMQQELEISSYDCTMGQQKEVCFVLTFNENYKVMYQYTFILIAKFITSFHTYIHYLCRFAKQAVFPTGNMKDLKIFTQEFISMNDSAWLIATTNSKSRIFSCALLSITFPKIRR